MMVIEFVSGWAAPQSGATSPALMAFPRVLVLALLLLAGALVIFYGKSLYFANWKIALSSAFAVKQRAVEKPAKDPRLKMDAVAARRASREAFLRQHNESNFNFHPHKDKELGLSVTETYVKNSRGLEIFLKSWVPAERRPKGLIFICHGYGDTVTFFFEGLTRALAVAGYAVYGVDYPGFGLSEGLHGYIPNFDILVDDVMEQYRIIKERPENEGLPCFLFGESMGGAVALKAHLKDSSMWDGAVLVAPMCKIAEAMYPPWYLVQILIALAHVIPRAKIVPHTDIAEIGFRDLDKRKRASFNPAAYIGNPRLGTALQLLQTTDYIESKLTEVSLPLLILHGAADQVTDPSISILLHENAKSKDKTLRLYDEAWHCLLQGEPDAVVKNVMMDIISWLDAHTAASKGGFSRQREQEMKHRVATATPSMVAFGKYDLIKELL